MAPCAGDAKNLRVSSPGTILKSAEDLPDLKTVTAWNRLGLRAAYGQIMLRLAEENSDLIVLSADLGRSSGLDRFVSAFPDRYIGTGIAEQNMVGTATGLAFAGMRVFASSFAPFLTMRAGDQVRMGLGYMQAPVVLVGLASGLSLGFLGSSHYGLEDLAVMGAIPGLEIVSPSDAWELFLVLNDALLNPRPLYVRLTGSTMLQSLGFENSEKPLTKHPQFLVPPESRTVVVASGTMIQRCQAALDGLCDSSGKRLGLAVANWLRPLGEEFFRSHSGRVNHWIVAEEHFERGGLGSELSRLFSAGIDVRPRVSVLGIGDAYPHGASYAEVLRMNQLDVQGLRNRVLALI